ncbi:hypothetical protein R1sor_014447 [Riccia sorocarpa]|uniref:Uncharacterized protein n=1 Tax=Riccia sorocarpa TaxID=122646 RepID=A0ABD3H9N5_9MARC
MYHFFVQTAKRDLVLEVWDKAGQELFNISAQEFFEKYGADVGKLHKFVSDRVTYNPWAITVIGKPCYQGIQRVLSFSRAGNASVVDCTSSTHVGVVRIGQPESKAKVSSDLSGVNTKRSSSSVTALLRLQSRVNNMEKDIAEAIAALKLEQEDDSVQFSATANQDLSQVKQTGPAYNVAEAADELGLTVTRFVTERFGFVKVLQAAHAREKQRISAEFEAKLLEAESRVAALSDECSSVRGIHEKLQQRWRIDMSALEAQAIFDQAKLTNDIRVLTGELESSKEELSKLQLDLERSNAASAKTEELRTANLRVVELKLKEQTWEADTKRLQLELEKLKVDTFKTQSTLADRIAALEQELKAKATAAECLQKALEAEMQRSSDLQLKIQEATDAIAASKFVQERAEKAQAAARSELVKVRTEFCLSKLLKPRTVN